MRNNFVNITTRKDRTKYNNLTEYILECYNTEYCYSSYCLFQVLGI
jgi:hypothetical protein